MTLDAERLAELVAAIPPERLAGERWFSGKERRIARIALVDALGTPSSELDAMVAVVGIEFSDGPPERYVLTVGVTADGLAEPGEGTCFWAPLLARGLRPGLRGVFELRPSPALPRELRGEAERPLGIDQSNSSFVLGERLVVKCYRRLQPGVNPEIELVRFLTERGFVHAPAFAGSLHWLPAEGDPWAGSDCAIALLQEYVPQAEDGWGWAKELLAETIHAGGRSGALAEATAFAAELGAVTAELHAVLAAASSVPGFEPRRADAGDVSAWRQEAESQFARALAVVEGETASELQAAAARVRAEIARFEKLAEPPLLTRVHGDYHLGQVLRSPAGFHVIDFEGEPTKTLAQRREHGSPLRDVAAMLRSFDHLARWVVRKEVDAPDAPEALRLAEAWIDNARTRFLAAYRRGLSEAGAPLKVDDSLVHAFEVEKETYEFSYAAAFLPEWMFVPREAMRALLERPPETAA